MELHFPLRLPIPARRSVLVIALAISLFASTPNAAMAACEAQQLATTEPSTITIAGSGHPGIDDGDSTAASFVEPDGVAVDTRGVIYVADRGGQNVRMIANGHVTTLAGVSDPTELSQVRTGGYVDGPAQSARFRSPRAIAVGKDGTIYVADVGNHAIRKIHAGIVSTVAGPPSANAVNLIPDPAFTLRDGRPEAWILSPSSRAHGDLHFADHAGPAGSNALLASATSGASATSAPIEVQPGSAYTLSVFLDSRGNTSNGNVAFYIVDASTNAILQGYGTAEGTNGRVNFSSWNVPPNVRSIRISYRLNGTGITGPVIFAQPVFAKGAYIANPSALAIDDDDTLYVADAGTGILKIDASGGIALVTSDTPAPYVCGLSVRGSGKNVVLGYTDGKSIHMRVAGVEKRSLTFDDSARFEPQFIGRTIGFACGLAVFDAYTAVVTDYRTNAVRFLRFPIEAPVGSGAMIKTLVGGVREGQDAIGGYRDGSTDLAIADVPRGIARSGDNALVFADSGNRRIREIDYVDPRGPQTPGFAGLQSPEHRYRVAVVGASQTFHSVLWQQSIPGQIESGLAAMGDIGPKECPYVIDFRFSGIDVDKALPLISNYLGDGETDLVIYLVDIGHGAELKRDANWKSQVPGQFRTLASQLKSNQTKMLLVSFPDEKTASDLEGVAVRDSGDYEATSDLLGKFHAALAEEDAVAASGVRTLRMVRTFEKAEESPMRSQYFESGLNYHASTVGQIFIGHAIVDELRSWRPWALP